MFYIRYNNVHMNETNTNDMCVVCVYRFLFNAKMLHSLTLYSAQHNIQKDSVSCRGAIGWKRYLLYSYSNRLMDEEWKWRYNGE